MESCKRVSVTVVDSRSRDAKEVREILRSAHSDGVAFTEAPRWWLWTRFEASGPEQAMYALHDRLLEWHGEKFGEPSW
jgi:ribulose bisphosphate carboxylase small subunit